MSLREMEQRLREQERHGDSTAREWLDGLREEQHTRQQTAKIFEEAVVRSDCEAFYEVVNLLMDQVVDGWPTAITKVAKLQQVSPAIQNAFLRVWMESKMLPLSVGRRRTLARALRVLLPRPEIATPVRLFRGARARRRRRVHGFSWSAAREVAERFAEGNRTHPLGAVLLETLAPPQAILHVRENFEGYYAESEYIVDPYTLRRVTVIARYPSTLPPEL